MPDKYQPKDLLGGLARAAGGRVVVTTCIGAGWTHRARV